MMLEIGSEGWRGVNQRKRKGGNLCDSPVAGRIMVGTEMEEVSCGWSRAWGVGFGTTCSLMVS